MKIGSNAWMNIANIDIPAYIVLVILLLIFLLLVVTVVAVKTWIFKRVQKYSTKYHQLLEINEKHVFKELPELEKIYKTYPSLQQFRNRDFYDELLQNILKAKNTYRKLITDAEENQRLFRTYISEVLALEKSSKESVQKSRLPQKLFKKIEDVAVSRGTLQPVLGTSVFIVTQYTSPKGRNSYRDEQLFLFDQVQSTYHEAERIEEQRKQVAEQRRKERAKMTPSLRYEVLRRDHFRCQICGAEQSDGVKLHVDHIIPIAKGGKTELSNLRTLCDLCNIGKGAKTEM